jgi:thioredoxin 1
LAALTFAGKLVTMVNEGVWRMAEISKLSEADFQSEVIRSELPVLVDFTAVWCGPCKMLDPLVKQLADEWSGKVKVVKLDVDDNPQVTMDYQIMGVPTLILFKNGKPVERLSGYAPKDKLVKKFGSHL